MSPAPVVIIGGGPGGSSTSMFLSAAGIESVIVEAAEFPRFSVGEALTGSAGKLLRRMGLGDALMAQGHAVKTGAMVAGHNGKTSFRVPAVDLLDDGVRTPTSTWQVRRADFDKLLLDTAVERGAELVRGRVVDVGRDADGRLCTVRVERDGIVDDLHARAIVDASGMHGLLHRLGVTSPKERGRYDAQIALYSHVRGADRDPDGTIEPEFQNNTVMCFAEKNHWGWFIPVDDETVSIGIVVPTSTYRAAGLDPRGFFERQLRELNPAIARRVARAEIVRDVDVCKSFSYRIREFVGPGWLCVGDSHRFIDPFFAFGVHLALFEGRMAAEAIAQYVVDDDVAVLLDYQRRADAAQDVVQDLIDAFWNEPLAFGYMIHKKFRDDLIDIFAGRIYDVDNPSAGLQALRRINAATAAKEAAGSWQDSPSDSRQPIP